MEQKDGTVGGDRRRRWAYMGLLAAAGVGVGGFALWRQRTPAVATIASEKRSPRRDRIAEFLARGPARIAEQVYLLGDMRPSAVYVIDTSEGLAMIDTGLETAHDKLLAGMSKLGLDFRRLKIVLLTHAHGDHSQGAQRLRDETGARIYIGREDAQALRRGGPWEAFFSKFDMKGESLHPTTVDGELSDGQVLQLGEARFRAIATPGHTPGSCCYLLEIGGQRVLFTGDTLQAFTVNTGTYAAGLPPRYGGDVQRYLHSLEILRDLPTPDLVLPGHPGSDGTPNPRLTDEEWTALVDRGLVDLQKWRTRFERDGADFLDGTPKQILDGLFYLGDFEGVAAYALVTEGRALLFSAMRGDDAAKWLAAVWERLGRPRPTTAALVLTSCESESLTGLRSFLEVTGCPVVVPAEWREAVTAACPDGAAVVSSADLASLGWGNITLLPFDGVGKPQLIYAFRHDDAMVLVSGAFPLDIDMTSFDQLSRRGAPAGWDAALLTRSLAQLSEIQPDVWLSASPAGGRNANLYDRDWSKTLKLNEQLFRQGWANSR